MNLFYLRYFVTLAHEKHYTKAAKQLCITQPSLSHAIDQLEKELGVQLFERAGRNTTLTRFGEEFLACAEHTLETLDDGVETIKRSAAGDGVIRLGFVRPLGIKFIPKLAAEFLRKNEGKNISFTFNTDVTGKLLAGMKDKRFDILFCSEPPQEFGFHAVAVKRQELVLIVPGSHPLASRDEVRLCETVDFDYVYFHSNSGIRKVIDDMFAREKITPRIVCETEEDEVIAGLVAAGFGIAVVPYMDMLLKLDVKIIKITSPSYERSFFMVNDDRLYMPPVVKSFYDFVLEKEKICLE